MISVLAIYKNGNYNSIPKERSLIIVYITMFSLKASGKLITVKYTKSVIRAMQILISGTLQSSSYRVLIYIIFIFRILTMLACCLLYNLTMLLLYCPCYTMRLKTILT